MTIRAVAASSDASGIQSDEGGSQPTLLLQLFDLGDPTWTDRYDIRYVNRTTAADWFAKYHYSGTYGAENSTFYGVFLGDLACVVGIGYSANEFGLATKFGLTDIQGNLEVTRVAVHPNAPRNSPSRFVRAVLRRVASRGIEWVFSYADTGQGHHGGIYQALGAVYVGRSEARHGFLIDGVPIHPRVIVHLFGTQARQEAIRLARQSGRTLEYVEGMNAPKHTYILPIGSRALEVRERLAPFAKPYPKRIPT